MPRYCCIIGVWLLKLGSFKLFSSLAKPRVTTCTDGGDSKFRSLLDGWNRPVLSSLVSRFGVGGGIGLRSIRNEETATTAYTSHYRRPARRKGVRRPDHPGLRVRRTNAARVFFYRYRARDGALREIKLGEFGPMTPAEARKALGRLKLERERGADPQMEKQQARAEARRQREAEKLARYTVEKLVEDYIAERQHDSFQTAPTDRFAIALSQPVRKAGELSAVAEVAPSPAARQVPRQSARRARCSRRS